MHVHLLTSVTPPGARLHQVKKVKKDGHANTCCSGQYPFEQNFFTHCCLWLWVLCSAHCRMAKELLQLLFLFSFLQVVWRGWCGDMPSEATTRTALDCLTGATLQGRSKKLLHTSAFRLAACRQPAIFSTAVELSCCEGSWAAVARCARCCPWPRQVSFRRPSSGFPTFGCWQVT